MRVKRKALSVKEAAKVLGVSERHLYNMLAQGELKGARLGARWLIPLDAVEALVGPLGEALEAEKPPARAGAER